METYDFFVAGRWRNRTAIEEIVSKLRRAGFSVFCFLENDYTDVLIDLGLDERAMEAENTEKLPQEHPLIRAIFQKDLEGQKTCKHFLLVFPAGLAAHMEAGISYGLGKKCYAIGAPDKTETLYSIFEKIYPDIDHFIEEFRN